MAKKTKKNKKKVKRGTEKAAAEDKAPKTASPAATSLGTGRAARAKVPKVSAKEKSALAKEAARAAWSERMDAEGR